MPSTMIISNPIIPLGSTILVTGANGLIGSHIADQCLAAGYKVRGTVRDTARCAWLTDFFTKRYNDDQVFSLVQVVDPRDENAFSTAVSGCAGIIHSATHFDLFSSDLEGNISSVAVSITRVLEAAAAEPSVKSVVLCSSAWAAHSPAPSEKYSITPASWNDAELERARTNPKPFSYYMAGKIAGERAAWSWIAQHKPRFAFSAVLPDTVFGGILSPKHQGIPSTAGAIKILLENGDMSFPNLVEPQWFSDAADMGRLHVAAMVDPKANGQRFLGHAERFNWNDVLAILRRVYPDRVLMDDLPLNRDVGEVDASASVALLSSVFGQTAWTSLEESVRANAESCAALG